MEIPKKGSASCSRAILPKRKHLSLSGIGRSFLPYSADTNFAQSLQLNDIADPKLNSKGQQHIVTSGSVPHSSYRVPELSDSIKESIPAKESDGKNCVYNCLKTLVKSPKYFEFSVTQNSVRSISEEPHLFPLGEMATIMAYRNPDEDDSVIKTPRRKLSLSSSSPSSCGSPNDLPVYKTPLFDKRQKKFPTGRLLSSGKKYMSPNSVASESSCVRLMKNLSCSHPSSIKVEVQEFSGDFSPIRPTVSPVLDKENCSPFPCTPRGSSCTPKEIKMMSNSITKREDTSGLQRVALKDVSNKKVPHNGKGYPSRCKTVEQPSTRPKVSSRRSLCFLSPSHQVQTPSKRFCSRRETNSGAYDVVVADEEFGNTENVRVEDRAHEQLEKATLKERQNLPVQENGVELENMSSRCGRHLVKEKLDDILRMGRFGSHSLRSVEKENSRKIFLLTPLLTQSNDIAGDMESDIEMLDLDSEASVPSMSNSMKALMSGRMSGVDAAGSSLNVSNVSTSSLKLHLSSSSNDDTLNGTKSDLIDESDHLTEGDSSGIDDKNVSLERLPTEGLPESVEESPDAKTGTPYVGERESLFPNVFSRLELASQMTISPCNPFSRAPVRRSLSLFATTPPTVSYHNIKSMVSSGHNGFKRPLSPGLMCNQAEAKRSRTSSCTFQNSIATGLQRPFRAVKSGFVRSFSNSERSATNYGEEKLSPSPIKLASIQSCDSSPEPPAGEGASPEFAASTNSSKLTSEAEKPHTYDLLTRQSSAPAGQKCDVTTVKQRTLSESHVTIMRALNRSQHKEEQLTGDFDKPLCLPVLSASRLPDLMSITPETVARLINGDFSEVVESYEILDCRYPYEFEGGHIQGAESWHSLQCVHDRIDLAIVSGPPTPKEPNKRHILIFHCEFSAERAPRAQRLLRERDRNENKDWYPFLYFPETYLLEGGYKAFYEQYPNLCHPSKYTKMLDENFSEDLKFFRAKSKAWATENKPKKGRIGLRLRYSQATDDGS